MSLARIVVSELGTALRISYVVISELLPRFRGALGLRTRGLHVDQASVDFYQRVRDEKFVSQYIHKNTIIIQYLL